MDGYQWIRIDAFDLIPSVGESAFPYVTATIEMSLNVLQFHQAGLGQITCWDPTTEPM